MAGLFAGLCEKGDSRRRMLGFEGVCRDHIRYPGYTPYESVVVVGWKEKEIRQMEPLMQSTEALPLGVHLNHTCTAWVMLYEATGNLPLTLLTFPQLPQTGVY